MKIKKHQSGGIYYTPFFRESLQQGQQAAASQTTSKSGDSTANQIEKEMISVLKENGLPSDVDYFLKQAEKFLSSVNEFGFEKDVYGLSNLIRLQSYANKVRHNKELHTKAIDRIQTEGAGSEVAVSDTGLLYIYDSNNGNVKKVTANDYKENAESYQLLTNSQLADLRANSQDLKYDSSILTDLNATIGMKSIVTYVTDVIGKFGKEGVNQPHESYKIKKGFDEIIGDGPDGYYKVKQLIKKTFEGYDPYANPDERDAQITSAVNYLYRILPPEMKNALKAQSIGEGYDPTTSAGAKSLLLQALSYHTDHEIQQDQSLTGYMEPDTGSGSGGSGSGKESQIPESWAHSVFKDMGLPIDTRMIMNKGNVRIYLPGIQHDSVFTKNNNQLYNTLADFSYRNLQEQGLVDSFGKMYFNELEINNISTQGQGILVDNSKGGRVVYMPIKPNGEIDFYTYNKMDQIQKDIVSKRITDEATLKKIWEDNGFIYDPVFKIGQPVNQETKRYWVQEAYTTSKSGAFDRKQLNMATNIQEVEDDEFMEKLTMSYNMDPVNKKNQIDFTTGTAYEGLIFIPMQSNENQVLVANSQAYIGKPNADQIKAMQDATIYGGGYDINSRRFSGLSGTSSDDL